MRRTAIAAMIAFTLLAVRSAADENLTLELPSYRPPAEAPLERPAPSTSSVQQFRAQAPQEIPQRRAAVSSKTTSKRYASRGGQNVDGVKQYTVGRLGIATRSASIRAGRSGSRTLLSRVKPGTYVALNCESGDWYGVLMADRTIGWVKKFEVQMLAYDVVSNRLQDTAYSSSPNYQQSMLNGSQRTILDIAWTYIGVPYRWGGTAVSGLDCSAFVKRCFSTVGVGLPRTAREQIAFGIPVTSDQLQAADRVYFQNSRGEITHTGIFLGRDDRGHGYFIHASSRHKGVAVSRLDEDVYARMYAGARR